MTHLLLVRGVVCAGTNVVADVVVVAGAVGAEDVVVTLLVTLFA